MSKFLKLTINSKNQELDRPKSENGGSTNMSDGSVEADEEFKTKKGQKFLFINEDVQNWPQWSVDQKADKPEPVNEAAKQPEQTVEAVDYYEDDDYMYNRGISFPIFRKSKKTNKKENEAKTQKVGFFQKIKNWLD